MTTLIVLDWISDVETDVPVAVVSIIGTYIVELLYESVSVPDSVNTEPDQLV